MDLIEDPDWYLIQGSLRSLLTRAGKSPYKILYICHTDAWREIVWTGAGVGEVCRVTTLETSLRMCAQGQNFLYEPNANDFLSQDTVWLVKTVAHLE